MGPQERGSIIFSHIYLATGMRLGFLGPDGFLQPDNQSLPMLLCHDYVTFLIGLAGSQSIILSKRTNCQP